ncbi:hypothetical protein ACVBIO_01095 [Shewanella sp. 0m-8]
MMKISLRTSDLLVRYNNALARIQLAGKEHVTLVFENQVYPPLVLENSALESAYGENLFIVNDVSPLSSNVKLTPENKMVITRINTYLEELRKLTGPKGVGGLEKRKLAIVNASKLLDDSKPPSPSTLGEWAKDANVSINGASNRYLKPIKRNRSTQFNSEVKILASDTINEFVIKPMSTSFQAAFDIFVDQAKLRNLKYPSLTTFTKWIKSVEPKLVNKNKYSRNERKKLFRNACEKMRTSRPLERVEADAVHLQIGIVDENGTYLGPLLIVILICAHTRCIVGYSMKSGRGESGALVVSAMRHALCPKPEGSFTSRNGNPWFCYGVFEKLVVDGGPGFTSTVTQSYLMSICNSTIETNASSSPWLKPYVERFNSTVRMNFAPFIPGYIGILNEQVANGLNIKDNAVLTLSEVRGLFEAWIVDEYHHMPLTSFNNQTPYQLWHKALAEGFVPEVPLNIEKVMLPTGEIRDATISGDSCHLGVQINKVRYNDDNGLLKNIGLKLKAAGKPVKVECHYSEVDVSSISVVNPFTEEVFIVMATDKDIMVGTTLEEFKAKNPSTYQSKGYRHSRVLADVPLLKQKKEELQQKRTTSQKTGSRRAVPEDFDREIQEQTQANNRSTPKLSEQDPLAGLDLNSIKRLKTK